VTLARRLAEVERCRLDRALAHFRRTHDAWARPAKDPERQAELEELHRTVDERLTPEQRQLVQDIAEGMQLLAEPGATEAQIAWAIELLEPGVVPRGSPPYVIVGAMRRMMVQGLARDAEDADAEGQ